MLDNAANDPTFIKRMKREFTNTTSKLFNNLTKGAAKLSRNQNNQIKLICFNTFCIGYKACLRQSRTNKPGKNVE